MMILFVCSFPFSLDSMIQISRFLSKFFSPILSEIVTMLRQTQFLLQIFTSQQKDN